MDHWLVNNTVTPLPWGGGWEVRVGVCMDGMSMVEIWIQLDGLLIGTPNNTATSLEISFEAAGLPHAAIYLTQASQHSPRTSN
jgi:hypothetical protein